MKTTSILTLTGVLSIGLLTFMKFDGHRPKTETVPAHQSSVLNEPFKEGAIYMDLATEKTGMQPSVDSSEYRSQTVTKAGCDGGETGSADLCLDAIVYIEDEDPIELGFDVDEYLPADFNPYKNYTDVDLDEIVYIEDEDPIELGFDVNEYLPPDFNPFAGMEPDLSEIEFIEAEEPVVLGFDTRDYLPEGFNPYAPAPLQLEDIVYIDTEEDIDLGFDVDAYLPADFDPYAAPEFDLSQIPFMEIEEEVEIWDDNNAPAKEAAINL